MDALPSTTPAFVLLDVEKALAQVGDVEALRSMLPLLQDLLEQELPLVAKALEAADLVDARERLHSLKGCMPIFCVTDVCTQLAQVEHLAKTASVLEVQTAFAALHPQLLCLRSEVHDYLASPFTL